MSTEKETIGKFFNLILKSSFSFIFEQSLFNILIDTCFRINLYKILKVSVAFKQRMLSFFQQLTTSLFHMVIIIIHSVGRILTRKIHQQTISNNKEKIVTIIRIIVKTKKKK